MFIISGAFSKKKNRKPNSDGVADKGIYDWCIWRWWPQSLCWINSLALLTSTANMVTAFLGLIHEQQCSREWWEGFFYSGIQGKNPAITFDWRTWSGVNCWPNGCDLENNVLLTSSPEPPLEEGWVLSQRNMAMRYRGRYLYKSRVLLRRKKGQIDADSVVRNIQYAMTVITSSIFHLFRG